MAKSAIRRHHIARLKKKRKNYWGRDIPRNTMEPLTPRQLNMVVRYPKLCGCFMCSSKKKKSLGYRSFYEVRTNATSESEMQEYKQ